MQSKPQAPPRRHHFIPEFLLKRWAQPTGELLRYWRTKQGLCSKRQAPRAVCFEMDLYKTVGLSPEHAQQMEVLFMGPLDSKAALAHDHLVERGEGGLSDQQRIDWARFILSIWFRTPQDVDLTGQAISLLADSIGSKLLLKKDRPVGLHSISLNKIKMESLRSIIDYEPNIRSVCDMRWAVLDVTTAQELLISDSPECLPKLAPWLGAPDSYLTLPIAPSKLFVATGSKSQLNWLRRLSSHDIIHRQNRSTVAQATNFVGATNDKATKFIARYFGTAERPSKIRDIAASYRVDIPL